MIFFKLLDGEDICEGQIYSLKSEEFDSPGSRVPQLSASLGSANKEQQ